MYLPFSSSFHSKRNPFSKTIYHPALQHHNDSLTQFRSNFSFLLFPIRIPFPMRTNYDNKTNTDQVEKQTENHHHQSEMGNGWEVEEKQCMKNFLNENKWQLKMAALFWREFFHLIIMIYDRKHFPFLSYYYLDEYLIQIWNTC